MLKVHAKNLGNVAVLSLQGRIVNGETEILHDAVDAVTDASVLILDLARVTTVDARGLGLMLELRQEAEARGIRFELMNLTKMVGKVLEIAHLDSVFKISSGVEFFPAVARSRRAHVPVLASCA